MDRIVIALVTAGATALVVGLVVWRALGGVEDRVRREATEHAAQVALCAVATPRPAPCTMVEVGFTWTGESKKHKRCDVPERGCGKMDR